MNCSQLVVSCDFINLINAQIFFSLSHALSVPLFFLSLSLSLFLSVSVSLFFTLSLACSFFPSLFSFYFFFSLFQFVIYSLILNFLIFLSLLLSLVSFIVTRFYVLTSLDSSYKYQQKRNP